MKQASYVEDVQVCNASSGLATIQYTKLSAKAPGGKVA